MHNVSKYARNILAEMEKLGFTQGEVELLPKLLSEQIEENSKQIEYHKPFAVFKFTDGSSDQ